jgi:hypothetical protein
VSSIKSTLPRSSSATTPVLAIMWFLLGGPHRAQLPVQVKGRWSARTVSDLSWMSRALARDAAFRRCRHRRFCLDRRGPSPPHTSSQRRVDEQSFVPRRQAATLGPRPALGAYPFTAGSTGVAIPCNDVGIPVASRRAPTQSTISVQHRGRGSSPQPATGVNI